MVRRCVLLLAVLPALAAAQGGALPGGADARASGFVEAGGRLTYFEVVRDSVVVLGEGAEGRPRVVLPYAAFVEVLGRSARAGALAPDTLRGPSSLPFALAVDDRAVVRLATAVPVGTLALGVLGFGLIALVGGAVVWERRARRARRLRAEFRRRLAAAREAERAHLARELHDGPVQDLCAVQVALAAEPGGEGARRAVTAVVGEIRALCDELRPQALDAFGLAAALAGLVDRAAEGENREGGADLDVRLRVEPAAGAAADGPALSDERRLALYRIAQEALNNAVQHAAARRVDVALALDGAALRLTVDDDGVGPPQADALDYAADGHYGLLGMHERAVLLRADLAVSRGPLGGTRVALDVPLPAHRLAAPQPAAPPRPDAH
ncbi:histidine kinase [Rubrivirga sp. S365]|uniref:histidine kinase n=1 Tax=Rubrivirga litoralis TaxID=3075598 RepID=A0ABU3BP96_9BACT|nr:MULTISPECIES: ATP-binding protein [unclassified Rubrivirga]MDT0631104.1 histidine kinase [Rubrivirga sp. F394]MDT7855383.1 histidine kinase [Rubrivirga sp. S365]